MSTPYDQSLLVVFYNSRTGADRDLLACYGTPLMFAAGQKDAEIVRILLAAKADGRRITPENNSALHIASYYGNYKIVEMLLAANALVNIQDAEGQTPLHLACENGSRHIVESLICAGANYCVTLLLI